MASRGDVLISLVGLIGTGLILVLNNLPRSEPRQVFAITDLERTLDQVRNTALPDGPSAELSMPGLEDYYTFSILDDEFVLRLESLSDEFAKTVLHFEKVVEELGLVAERPDDKDYGLEKTIAVRLGDTSSGAARAGAQVMDKVSGIRAGSKINVATVGFKSQWRSDA